MKTGDLVKCQLFEKNGVITGMINLSTPTSYMEVAKLQWNTGEEETVNVTEHPQRLKIMTDMEANEEAVESFGRDLAEP